MGLQRYTRPDQYKRRCNHFKFRVYPECNYRKCAFDVPDFTCLENRSTTFCSSVQLPFEIIFRCNKFRVE